MRNKPQSVISWPQGLVGGVWRGRVQMSCQDVGSALEGWQLGSCRHQLSLCAGCQRGSGPVGPPFHSKGKVASGVVRGRDAAKSRPPQEVSVGGRGRVFILCFYIIEHEDQPRDCLTLPWLDYLPLRSASDPWVPWKMQDSGRGPLCDLPLPISQQGDSV